LDFLRGLLAVGVMLYHVLAYEHVARLYVVGRYAVYAFFVLSGFSLSYAYHDRLGSPGDVRSYLFRRYARIAPLYYAALALTVATVPGAENPDFNALMWNLTLLFGFADPARTSLVGGGWSIGIECAFYATFPVIMAIVSARRWFAISAVAASCAVSLGWANHKLAGASALGTAWVALIQPIGFMGYFFAGCWGARLHAAVGTRPMRRWAVAGLLFTAVCWTAVPIHGDVDLLVGWKGTLLMASTITLVLCTAFVPVNSTPVQGLARFLGDVSYGVYLLHPVAYCWLATHVPGHPLARIAQTTALSLGGAFLLFHAFEAPSRRLGYRLLLAGTSDARSVSSRPR
jgi:peptidoglycan/LPS O-acetylase OafA/YrhL